MESALKKSVRADGYSFVSLSPSKLFPSIAEDFLYSGTSALLLLVANLFPGYWYFSFIALFPFLWKVNRASAREAFRLGFLLGLTFFTFWSVDAFSLAPVSTILKILGGTFLFALWGWVVGLIKQYFGFNPIIVSGLWVFFELALIKLGYTSGLLTYSTLSTPFILRLSTLFGFGIISFIVVLFNSVLVKAIEYAAKTLKAQILEFSISELTWDLVKTCHLFSQRFFFVPQLRAPPASSSQKETEYYTLIFNTTQKEKKMTVNKLKITTMLLTVVALVLIFSATTILADTELYYPIVDSIICHPGAPPTTKTPTNNLSNIQETYQGDTVTFRISSSCTNVNINGVSPIGNFNLTTGTPQHAIIFPTIGTYIYTIIDNGQSPPETTFNAKIITTPQPPHIPSLSTWGIIILIALIMVTGVYLWMRRKPVTT